MRDILVALQFYPLGVDQQQASVLWSIPKEQAGQDGIEADTLAGTRCSGDEQMGHSGQICPHRLTGGIFPEGDGQRCGRAGEGLGFQNYPDGHHFPPVVREFNTDRGFAGDWRHHAETGGFKRHGQVIGETDNATDLDSRCRSIFIHGDHRPGRNPHHFSLNPEVSQFFFKGPRIFLESFPVRSMIIELEAVEHFGRGEGVVFGRIEERLGSGGSLPGSFPGLGCGRRQQLDCRFQGGGR